MKLHYLCDQVAQMQTWLRFSKEANYHTVGYNEEACAILTVISVEFH